MLLYFVKIRLFYFEKIKKSNSRKQPNRGHAVEQLVDALRYKPEGRELESRWCYWNFSMTQSFRPHYCIEIDSDSHRNKYQEY
jgi:hypothetical protein